MGAGIACSIITGATPLSHDPWRLSNLMTATCLTAVTSAGGPRCCKRDVFLTVITAVEFLNRNLNASIPVETAPACDFSHLNRECITGKGRFFKG